MNVKLEFLGLMYNRDNSNFCGEVLIIYLTGKLLPFQSEKKWVKYIIKLMKIKL